MEYDRGESFPSDFEPNEILIGSKSKGKLSPRPYPIQYERKWNTSLHNVGSLRTITAPAITAFGMCLHHVLF